MTRPANVTTSFVFVDASGVSSIVGPFGTITDLELLDYADRHADTHPLLGSTVRAALDAINAPEVLDRLNAADHLAPIAALVLLERLQGAHIERVYLSPSGAVLVALARPSF